MIDPTRYLAMTWYAVINDEIGGWSVATANMPTSQLNLHDRMLLWDGFDEQLARHVAGLHNEWLRAMEVGSAVQAPERIQRKRTRGWRMPPNTVYVGRPSRWGNKFQPWNAPAHRKDDVQAWLVEAFREWCSASPAFQGAVRAELAGRNLACWCPLYDGRGNRVPCHADVLLTIANPDAGARL